MDETVTVQLAKDETTRVAVLRDYHILDTAPEAAYDDITRLAASVCRTPMASITLVDTDRQWFKSILGMEVRETPRTVSFCHYTIQQAGVMIVPDTLKDAHLYNNPLVTGDPHVRFYAGVPIVNTDGFALGSLWVADYVPRTLSADQEDALLILARQVMAKIELQRQVERGERWIAERLLGEEMRTAGEDALRQLAAAVESTTDGVVICDARKPDCPITYANQAFLFLTGYEMDEVLGRNCRCLQGPLTDPATTKRIRKSIDEKRSCRVTLQNYRKDGSTFWNELTIAPVKDSAGQVTQFVGIQHDISALKESEEALLESNLALYESNTRLVEAQRIGKTGDWRLDVSTMKFTWSAEVFRLLEFDPSDGQPPYEVVQTRYYPEDRAVRDRLFAHALATGEQYVCDLRLILPSGLPRTCHLVGHPVMGVSGRVTRIVGTATDITEHVAREQEIRSAYLVLEEQKVLLESANRVLNTLAITDPLTGLLNHRGFYDQIALRSAVPSNETDAVALIDVDNFRFFNDAYGHAAGDEVILQISRNLSTVLGTNDSVAHFGGDEFIVLLQNIGDLAPGQVAADLREKLQGLTYMPESEVSPIPITVSVGVAKMQCGDTNFEDNFKIAERRLQRAKTGGQNDSEADIVRADLSRSLGGFTMLDALVTAVDNKDRYTRNHSDDVMEYSVAIARKLGLDESTQQTISVAALLHDVGKIGVPDAILRKPGALTGSEYEAIRQHPQMGAVMVTAVPGLEKTLDAVLHHHERWDGEGYPFGLKGEEIPLIARIMAVADAYSAMTTDRPYRKGMDKQAALTTIASGSGTQWDPVCTAAFLSSMGEGAQ